MWTAASGLGIALGPIAGGMLMRSFSWSSVFWINVPLLVAALLGTLHVVPDSRNPEATKLDPVGALLSIGAIGSLVYAIITAPAHGWTSSSSLAGFAVGATIGVDCSSLGSCAATSRCSTCACSPTAASPRAASPSAMLFFAMAGTVFLQAQYLQFVLGYTPLVAGFALVPAALGMLFGTGAGAHMNANLGGRVAVAAGTLVAAAGVAAQAGFIDGTSYVPTGVGPAAVRPRRRDRDAGRDRPHHGDASPGPCRRRLGRQRHRPRARRRARGRGHRQRRGDPLRVVDAARARSGSPA